MNISIPNNVKGALGALLIALASWIGYDQGTTTTPVENPSSPVVVTPTENSRAELGVNFTWAADKLIVEDTAVYRNTFKHVRFFQIMTKDYRDGNPSNTILEPCLDLENPWSCAEQSMKRHLVRVKALRSMFPHAIIWVAPEVLANRQWPCKGWTVDELGDPRLAGYHWAKAALATYGPVGGVVLAMTNEEWCQEAGRTVAYNEWRRGVIQAHRENPSCELGIGARHVRTKEWKGERLKDNVEDVAPDVWAYVDSTFGWADYHAHGIVDGEFLPHDQAANAPDYIDYFNWSTWLDSYYPNISKAVGEIAYTTSPHDVVATDAQKRADWPTYRSLLEELSRDADIVLLYQIEDHNDPEGAFSGSGVWPVLKDSIEAFAKTL